MDCYKRSMEDLIRQSTMMILGYLSPATNGLKGIMMTSESGVKFDPLKPVQTRGGLKAKIYRTDLDMSTGETILAMVTDEGGNDSAIFFHPDGRCLYSNDYHLDLVNVPEKVSMESDQIDKCVMDLLRLQMYENDILKDKLADCQRLIHLQGKSIDCLTEDNHEL